MTAIAKNKQRTRKRRQLTSHDRLLIVLYSIRSDIATLPRPPNRRLDGDSNKGVSGSSATQKKSVGEVQSNEQSDIRQCKTFDSLIGKLEAYERIIAKIDKLSEAALLNVESASLGGKPGYDWARPGAISIANGYYKKHKKLPTMRLLRDEFCYQFFRENPQLYIDKAGTGMSESDLATLRRNPHWSHWRDKKEKPVSGRWVSALLTELSAHLKRTGTLYEASPAVT
jgi:hypothetical protein